MREGGEGGGGFKGGWKRCGGEGDVEVGVENLRECGR